MTLVLHADNAHRFYYQLESTFGTPQALSSVDYKELVIQRGQFFDLGISKTDLDQNRASRVHTIADLFHDNFSGPIGYAFEAYATRDRLADLIHLVTQNRVSIGGATAYQKLFRMHATQPDFTANAGAFATVIWDSPIAGKDARFTSGILRELTISCDKTQPGQQNLVKVSGIWLFKKYEIDQTYSGTAAAQDISLRYLAHQLDLNLSSFSLDPANWLRFSITLRNNAVGWDKDSNGNPVTYFLAPGSGGITGTIELPYAATYVNALTYASAGTTFAFTLDSNVVGSGTTGYFAITGNAKIMNTPLAAAEGQMRIPIELQLGNTTGSGTDGCDLTIADGIAP